MLDSVAHTHQVHSEAKDNQNGGQRLGVLIQLTFNCALKSIHNQLEWEKETNLSAQYTWRQTNQPKDTISCQFHQAIDGTTFLTMVLDKEPKMAEC